MRDSVHLCPIKHPCQTPVAYITKQVNPSLAQPQWDFNGSLAKLEMISLEK